MTATGVHRDAKTTRPTNTLHETHATMRFHAAIVEKKGGPFVFRDVEVDEPQPDEVVVRIVAAGICGTDGHVRDHGLGGAPFPIVLGHEGAGVVERVGAAVRSVKPGDHVVLSFPSCGRCHNCLGGHPAYCSQNLSLSFGGKRGDGSNAYHGAHGHFFGQSSFASHALANERNVVKVPNDLPLELLAPLGCGLQTGAGAVLNVLKPDVGASLVVLGAGTVGLAAIMAARAIGVTTIVAVDRDDAKLAIAQEMGATHVIHAVKEDVKARILAIRPQGADHVIDLTGHPAMLAMAVEATAPTGTTVLIGAAAEGTTAPIDMGTLLNGRVLRGVIQGDAVPHEFLPKLIQLHREGKLPFDRLVKHYDIRDIERAFDDAKRGLVVKPVLRMSSMGQPRTAASVTP